MLLGAHMRHQALDRLGQIGHRGRGVAAAAAAFLERGAEAIDRALHVAGGAGLIAGNAAYRGGKPVLEVGVEAVLGLARLQVEEAEDQRAGEAEQRRRERDAHAAERSGQPFLQRIEQRAGVAADLEPVDHLADRADRLDQAPEGAEQAEEHEQAGHVARDIAGFIQAGRDRIQQMPHGLLRDRHPPGALAAENGCHRGQQRRAALDREAGIGDAEIVDPGHFRIEPDHLAERQDDADQEHRADQGVEPGLAKNAVTICLYSTTPTSPQSTRKTSIRTRKIRGEDSLLSSISMSER